MPPAYADTELRLQGDRTMEEKRAAIRHSFGVEQVVAGTVNGRMPPKEDFLPVRCIDISQTGIAFYQAHRPQYQEVVVGLGIEPNLVYFLARVVHVEMIELCGNLVFRVGCKLVGQVQWGEQPRSGLDHDDVDAFLFVSEFAP